MGGVSTIALCITIVLVHNSTDKFLVHIEFDLLGSPKNQISRLTIETRIWTTAQSHQLTV